MSARNLSEIIEIIHSNHKKRIEHFLLKMGTLHEWISARLRYDAWTYVDTNYFLSLILDDVDEAQHLFYTLRSPSYHVLVPQLVLGEITAKILEKSKL